MKTITLIFFMAVTALFLSSCNKSTSPLETESVNLADDDAVVEAVYDDIFNSVDNATIIAEKNLKSGLLESGIIVSDSCPSIRVTHPQGALWPKTITIDFGVGCVGLYENTRAGKIITVVTGPRNTSGSKRTVTFDNYFFNGIKVEGTKVLENTGPNTNNNVVISVKLTGGKLTFPDGTYIQRSFEQRKEWIAGFSTGYIWDDECLITGSTTGTNIKGEAYTNTIITALHWKRVCQFIVSGVVKIERTGVDAITIDYGDGECDSKAIVKRGVETKEILLKHKHRSMIR
jgi:hypothetical protein